MKRIVSLLALTLCTITTQCLLLELGDMNAATTVYISRFGYYVEISEGSEAIFSVCDAYCNLNYGTALGSLYNDVENDNLLSLLLEHHQNVTDPTAGISMKLKPSNSFGWADGIPQDYDNWGSGEPNVNNGECAVMDLSGAWKTASCEDGIKQFYCNKYTRVFSENFVVGYSPSDSQNASDAEDYCFELYGVTLGVIRSAEEQTEFDDSITKLNTSAESTVRIGLMGDGPGGDFYVWANGKTPEEYGYSNWDPAEDDDVDQDSELCVVNSADGWRAFPCDSGTFTLSCVLWTPTSAPTPAPVPAPTSAPTPVPVPAPTQLPTRYPTERPTEAPTDSPPTLSPTLPTEQPSRSPTPIPTASPIPAPVVTPAPVTTTEGAKDDDAEGLQWYLILIIVLAVLALVALLLLFLYKQQQKKEERYEVKTTQAIAMQTTNTTAATSYPAAGSSGEQTY